MRMFNEDFNEIICAMCSYQILILTQILLEFNTKFAKLLDVYFHLK